MEGHWWLGLSFPSPPLWSINNRLSSIVTTSGSHPSGPLSTTTTVFSMPRPLLPVVAMRERSVPPPPPPPFSLAQQQAPAAARRSSSIMYASAGDGKAGDCVELVFLRPFCMEGGMSLSLPACRVSCPTQPTLAGGARHDDASVPCNGRRRRRSRRERIAAAACLLLACVPGGGAAAGRRLLFFDGQDLTTASTTMPAGAAVGAGYQQGSATSGYRRRLSLTRNGLLRPPLSRRLEDSVTLLLRRIAGCRSLYYRHPKDLDSSPPISSRRLPNFPFRDRQPNPTMLLKLAMLLCCASFQWQPAPHVKGEEAKEGYGEGGPGMSFPLFLPYMPKTGSGNRATCSARQRQRQRSGNISPHVCTRSMCLGSRLHSNNGDDTNKLRSS